MVSKKCCLNGVTKLMPYWCQKSDALMASQHWCRDGVMHSWGCDSVMQQWRLRYPPSPDLSGARCQDGVSTPWALHGYGQTKSWFLGHVSLGLKAPRFKGNKHRKEPSNVFNGFSNSYHLTSMKHILSHSLGPHLKLSILLLIVYIVKCQTPQNMFVPGWNSHMGCHGSLRTPSLGFPHEQMFDLIIERHHRSMWSIERPHHDTSKRHHHGILPFCFWHHHGASKRHHHGILSISWRHHGARKRHHHGILPTFLRPRFLPELGEAHGVVFLGLGQMQRGAREPMGKNMYGVKRVDACRLHSTQLLAGFFWPSSFQSDGSMLGMKDVDQIILVWLKIGVPNDP